MLSAYSKTLAAANAVSYRLPWGTIRGLCWGNPGQVAVVCTHGWLDNAHSFLPVAEHWDTRQGALIALDFAGHGLSDHRPAGNHYHFIDYAYDLWLIIQQQDWQNLTLVGHSMGGFAANIVASLCSDRLKHLILIEAFGLVVSDGEDAHQQLLDGFQSRRKLSCGRWRDYSELASAVDARLKTADFSKELVEMLLQRGCYRNAKGRWQWRADPQVKSTSPYRLPAATVDQVLAKIDVPVTLLRGEAGYSKLANAVERWQHCIEQLNINTLPGGHHLHMESPQAIATLLANICRAE
ncbi:alpha/beta hydrolase [Idiomarina seosinensis]|uniref:alpha/beta fold hydrolase n=1 Tax=Idiomarina seosinensis TaxID=281739 RepID=UPI00384E4607